MQHFAKQLSSHFLPKREVFSRILYFHATTQCFLPDWHRSFSGYPEQAKTLRCPAEKVIHISTALLLLLLLFLSTYFYKDDCKE
jgi:hypothetical protein